MENIELSDASIWLQKQKKIIKFTKLILQILTFLSFYSLISRFTIGWFSRYWVTFMFIYMVVLITSSLCICYYLDKKIKVNVNRFVLRELKIELDKFDIDSYRNIKDLRVLYVFDENSKKIAVNIVNNVIIANSEYLSELQEFSDIKIRIMSKQNILKKF